ncbi:MAG: CDP-glycerol glycerophosphotransferase family protein [Gaiella sp.]
MADGRPVWLVLPDPFPTRVFVDCGIVDGLRERLGDRLSALLLLPHDEEEAFAGRLDGVRLLDRRTLLPSRVPPAQRLHRRLDRALDDRFGFYPLAVRHSLRHSFHPERMRAGHDNWFLDPDRRGPAPSWRFIERAMFAWHYSGVRYVPRPLVRALRSERPAIAVANVQTRAAVPFLVAARRLGLPSVGYVSSWDHTVGKGVMAPFVDRYLVQNEQMADDVAQYHGVPHERVIVTGWPQTDVFAKPSPRSSYDDLVRSLGLDPTRKVVLFAGNTPTNAPYEGRLVRRLTAWWRDSGSPFSLLFRPHPRDRSWRERYADALDAPGARVQEPSYTDLDRLATLLHHVDAVVANAGTVLLDAVVNDRPGVCVLFDEGAPEGERHAELNVVGRHYRPLFAAEPFEVARSFEELVSGLGRSLAEPEARTKERAAAKALVVGTVDGRAAARVATAIAEMA